MRRLARLMLMKRSQNIEASDEMMMAVLPGRLASRHRASKR